MENLYGIDYGAKLAGTTVIAYVEHGHIAFAASAKKQDADLFVLDFFAGRPAGTIFLDAPLGIPKVYRTGTDGLPPSAEPDFHYRACDRELGAMSPMFLGGLTARAMKLAYKLRQLGFAIQETYPGCLARHWELHDLGYKGPKADIASCLEQVAGTFAPALLVERLTDWHHMDALLALCSALRHAQGEAIVVGDGEGEIVY